MVATCCKCQTLNRQRYCRAHITSPDEALPTACSYWTLLATVGRHRNARVASFLPQTTYVNNVSSCLPAGPQLRECLCRSPLPSLTPEAAANFGAAKPALAREEPESRGPTLRHARRVRVRLRQALPPARTPEQTCPGPSQLKSSSCLWHLPARLCQKVSLSLLRRVPLFSPFLSEFKVSDSLFPLPSITLPSSTFVSSRALTGTRPSSRF